MLNFRNYITRIALAAVFLLYVSAFINHPPAVTSHPVFLSEISKQLKDGDLVLRLNNDPSSDLIRRFNRKDKSFSHAGMILIENGKPFVYHMITGSENPGGKMKRESLESFADRKQNSAIGFYRYDFSEKERYQANTMLKELFRLGISFDTILDLNTDNRMYCAEMISKVVGSASGNRIAIGSTSLTYLEARIISFHNKMPAALLEGKSIVAVDNLYMVRNCNLITKVSWK